MTVWAYLLVFNDELGSRSSVQQYLDSLAEVTYWYSCLPSAIFITSTATAGQLSEKIKQKFGTGNGKRFFITEVHSDRQGWLPKSAWHMLTNPDSPKLPKG